MPSWLHDHEDRVWVLPEVIKRTILTNRHNHRLLINHSRRPKTGNIYLSILPGGAHAPKPRLFIEILHQLYIHTKPPF